jgi:hypothetical protein
MDGKQNDVMNEIIQIALDFLRKSAGIVLVLIAVCSGLIYIALEQKRELMYELNTNRAEYRNSLQSVSARLDMCEEARSRLVVEVEVLKVKVAMLGAKRR